MLRSAKTALLAAALMLPFAAPASAQADKPLTILESVPGLTFPFFVHMMNQMKAEAERLGNITVIESDGQVSSPKQTADIEAAITQGVDGIVISPNEVDAMAPALQQAVEANIPVVTIDRRVDAVEGILAHVGADNVKGGEAQAELIMKLFPDGATVMNLQGQSGASPAIDRNQACTTCSTRPLTNTRSSSRTRRLRSRQGLAMTESALAGMDTPPQVIVAATDDMALGRHGSGARARSRRQGRHHRLRRAARSACPGPRRRADCDDRAVPRRAEPHRGADPRSASARRQGAREKVKLLTPVAITKDNLDTAERLSEAQ
jgi:ABC-type sugar transport system substrate-binding protein